MGEILVGYHLLVDVVEGVLDQHHEFFEVIKCPEDGLKCLTYPMGVQVN